MAFTQEIKEQDLHQFFKGSYQGIIEPDKTFMIEYSRGGSGWFVKHTFCKDGKFGGHAFLFCDFEVFYVAGGFDKIPSSAAMQEYSAKYVEFMTEHFGDEYVAARAEYFAKIEAEKAKVAERKEGREHSQQCIDEYLKSIEARASQEDTVTECQAPAPAEQER